MGERKPMYEQIRDVIIKKIQNKVYLPGTAIPNESVLAKRYEVSRPTVHRAMQELIEKGYLRRGKTSGLYVEGEKKHNSAEQEGLIRFAFHKSDALGALADKAIEKDIVDEKNIVVKTFHEGICAIGNRYGKLFGIPPELKVHYRRQIIYCEDQPLIYRTIRIPQYVFPNIEKIDFSVFSWEEIFSYYDVAIKKVVQRTDVLRLRQLAVKRLFMEEDKPLILVESMYYDYADRVVLCEKKYADPSCIKLISERM